MALSGFNRGGREDGGAAPPAAPAAPAGGNLSAFIDQGSEFEGKLSFKDTVRIDGRFKGEIASENTLIVGESGEIEATIRSNAVVISGSVVGDVHAGRQVVLHKSAQVEGNVNTPSIVMEEGAVLNGNLTMSSNASKGAHSVKGAIKPGGPDAGKDKSQG